MKKKKGGATIKLKSSYVTVSTSKKSIATVKKVKKSGKITSYKVSAKKAGKATITIKVKKGTYKGTYKCKVTVKAKKAPATPKPTAKVTPKVTVTPSEAPSEAPSEVPTEEPSDAPTEEPTEEPTATPTIKATVESASNIINDGKDLFVALTLKEQVSAADLKDTKITLTGAKTVTATFKELNADGKAVYVIDDAAALKPGDTSANGEYTITSDSLTIENIKTDYEEALAGNAIAGYVVKLGSDNGIGHAKVTVEGGQSVYTDSNGYYRVPATNGKKKVTVEADHYLDYVTTSRVDVNRNHVTSHNFQMKEFDVSKIKVTVTAKNDAASPAPVEGATVVVKRKSDGKIITGQAVGANDGSVVTASSTGVAIFGNSTTGLTPGQSIMMGADGSELFTKGETYIVSVSKKLPKVSGGTTGDLTDVYAEKTAEFTVGNKHEYEINMTMTKTKAIPSFIIRQTFKDNAAKTAIVDSNAMKAKYQIFSTVNGELEEIVAVTAEAEETVSSDTANIDLLKGGAETTKVKPLENATLPSGNYYVVITPTGVGSPTAATPAISVVKVAVTEGTAATANVVLENGTSRQISTDVNLGEDDATALGGKDSFVATSGSETTLEAVEKKTAAAASATNTDWDGKTFGKLGGTSLPVKVKYEIGQVMDDGVVIPVTTADMSAGIDAKWSGSAFIANGECKTLLSNAKYDITSAGAYLLPQTQKGVTLDKNNVTGRTPFTTKGAWNLAKAVIDVAADDSNALKGVKGEDLILKKFEVKDASTKEVKASKEVNIDGTGSSAYSADGTEKLTIDLDLANHPEREINLPAGNYIVEYTLENKTTKTAYKEIVSAQTKMIPLESTTVETTAKVEKATADTKIGGKISVRKDDGTVDNSFNFTTAKGLAVLLDADRKIAGFGEVSNTGAYSIEDGADGGSNKIVGGTYTLVIRMYGAERVVETVKIDAGQSVTKDIEAKAGGNGVIKARVQDTNQNPLIAYSSRPVAYDEYYVIPDAANYVSGKKTTLSILSTWDNGTKQETVNIGTSKYNVGLYYIAGNSDFKQFGGSNNVTVEWSGLSAGKYSVCMGVWNSNEAVGWNWLAGDTDTYKFKTETVVLKETGDKAYPEWAYEKVSGSKNVKVDVNFDSSIHSNADSYSGSDGSNYAIVVWNDDGTVAFQKLYKGDATPTTKQTISLPSHKTYTVELYTMSGKQVSRSTLTTQGVDTSVTMALNDADKD